MYYPYLRGKQFELIALREFSRQTPQNNNVVPIIEPIKMTFNGLNIAIKTMFANRLRFALVINPKEGDFRLFSCDIISQVSQVLSEGIDMWIPAFIYRRNDSEILSYIEKYNLKNLMIIFKDEVEVDDSLHQLLTNDVIKYIVNGCPNEKIFSDALKTIQNKTLIRLDNSFKERRRNIDYSEMDDEKFTEQHIHYRSEQYDGISDYTVLSKDFTEGGMLPVALAIHLTYEKNEKQIFVHHFLSDTNVGYYDVRKKFLEATTKVRDFFNKKYSTPALKELVQYLNRKRFPGLGVIKKLSIRNHIELMNQIMSREV